MATEWDDIFEAEYGLSLDGITGIIQLDDDPTVVLAGTDIPQSVIGIRIDPAEIWQKTGAGDMDWEKREAGGVIQVPALYLPVLNRDGVAVTKLPLGTDMKLPVIARDGSTVIRVSVEV